MRSQATPTIRRALADDASALAELGAATFISTFGHLYSREDLQAFLSETHSAEAHGRKLRDPGIGVWLAEGEGGRAIGYATAGLCKLPVPDLEPGAGEVRQLYVLQEYQGHRLGSTLLEATLAWLTEMRREPIYVGVWSENFGAQRLYGRYGFIKVGEYDFPVGNHIDREFILKRALDSTAP